jgi:hypothetical protein
VKDRKNGEVLFDRPKPTMAVGLTEEEVYLVCLVMNGGT